MDWFIYDNGLRHKRAKSKEALVVLSDVSINVFKRNIIDRFMGHPVWGRFSYLRNVRLAQFVSYYYKKRISENDYQSDILEEDIDDKDKGFATGLFQKYILEEFDEVITRRYERLVLRYYKPNKKLHPEKFSYDLVLQFTHLKRRRIFFNKQDIPSKCKIQWSVPQLIKINKYLSQMAS